MRTPRHPKATPYDLVELRKAHRILIGLCTGLQPGRDDYRAVGKAADAVRQCAVDWTGDPNVWLNGHTALFLPDTENRPVPEGWVREPEPPMGKLDGSR